MNSIPIIQNNMVSIEKFGKVGVTFRDKIGYFLINIYHNGLCRAGGVKNIYYDLDDCDKLVIVGVDEV